VLVVLRPSSSNESYTLENMEQEIAAITCFYDDDCYARHNALRLESNHIK